LSLEFIRILGLIAAIALPATYQRMLGYNIQHDSGSATLSLFIE